MGHGIVLIGLRRSGKTSVGRILAATLGLPFVDLDETVAAREGMSAAEVILKRGVAEFRRAESRALEAVVEGPPVVLAAGGGTAESAANRERLAGFGTVVYLDVPVMELLRRLAADPDPDGRPVLAGSDARGETVLLHEFRDPLYRAAAELVVDATGTPEEASARCAAALRGRST